MKHNKYLRWGLRAGAIAVLATIFALYHEPQFMLTLATQLWTCF